MSSMWTPASASVSQCTSQVIIKMFPKKTKLITHFKWSKNMKICVETSTKANDYVRCSKITSNSKSIYSIRGGENSAAKRVLLPQKHEGLFILWRQWQKFFYFPTDVAVWNNTNLLCTIISIFLPICLPSRLDVETLFHDDTEWTGKKHIFLSLSITECEL